MGNATPNPGSLLRNGLVCHRARMEMSLWHTRTLDVALCATRTEHSVLVAHRDKSAIVLRLHRPIPTGVPQQATQQSQPRQALSHPSSPTEGMRAGRAPGQRKRLSPEGQRAPAAHTGRPSDHSESWRPTDIHLPGQRGKERNAPVRHGQGLGCHATTRGGGAGGVSHARSGLAFCVTTARG